MSRVAAGLAILALALLSGTAALAASDYLDQMKPGDALYDLAAEMEARGCSMSETDISDFLGAREIGAESVIKDLTTTGDFRWDGANSYTLSGRGECR